LRDDLLVQSFELGRTIAAKRALRGIPATTVARAAGRSSTWLSLFETGKRPVSLEQLTRILNAVTAATPSEPESDPR